MKDELPVIFPGVRVRLLDGPNGFKTVTVTGVDATQEAIYFQDAPLPEMKEAS